MCPDGEAPFLATDEIRMEVRYPEIVNGLFAAAILDRFDLMPVAIVADQHVAYPHLHGGQPAHAVEHPEGMLARCLDPYSMNANAPDVPNADEHFLDLLQTQLAG